MLIADLNHPLRVPLAAEVHSRPFMRLDSAETVTHFAVYSRDDLQAHVETAHTQHPILSALCEHFGVSPPASGAKYFFYDFGRFRLKWECHTEFATFTFASAWEAQATGTDPFARLPLEFLPQQWLQGLQGKILVAAHVALEASSSRADTVLRMQEAFFGNLVVGSEVLQGALVGTDFMIHADGFTRFLVHDLSLQEQQAGRLVQRLLEIETYRMMALLGLPFAQQATPVLNGIEDQLATLTVAMVEAADLALVSTLQNAASEQAMLQTITSLAARSERLSLENSYRFSASEAYFRLVHARIDELREQRSEGMPSIAEFMERRLAPAMNTCAAVARRQAALAVRIANTNDLLRTRVGIVQEQQNRQILQSMNARAAQQLRLQQAVEGLSVVAISYYLAGLVNYAGKAAKSAGLPLNPDLLTGLMVPLIAFGVWWGLRRMHHSMHSKTSTD